MQEISVGRERRSCFEMESQWDGDGLCFGTFDDDQSREGGQKMQNLSETQRAG